MKIDLLQVPYHLQQRDVGTGKGPARFIESNAADLLADHGHEVVSETIELDQPVQTADDAIAELNYQLSERIKQAVAADMFPLALSGNCNSALGVLAGLNAPNIGIIWFDSHGDFNTPETSPSGFIDGMCLAIAAGLARDDLRGKIGLASPVAENAILLFGARDLDEKELIMLESSSVLISMASEVRGSSLRAALPPKLEQLRGRVADIYLHLDIDVLDPDVAPANQYNNMPGGLTLDEVDQAIRMIAGHFKIHAATLASFNPEVDQQDKSLKAGLQLLTTIADAVAENKEAQQ